MGSGDPVGFDSAALADLGLAVAVIRGDSVGLAVQQLLELPGHEVTATDPAKKVIRAVHRVEADLSDAAIRQGKKGEPLGEVHPTRAGKHGFFRPVGGDGVSSQAGGLDGLAGFRNAGGEGGHRIR